MPLTPEQQAELLALLESEAAIEPLRAFVSRVTPRYPVPPHVEPIVRLFERSRREAVRATISLPPRFAKTETCMNGLAWRLYSDPASHHAFLSGASGLARDKSRVIQRRFLDAGGLTDPRSSAVERWNTKQGGGLFSAGVGTHIQGKAINGVALLDDIVKGREAAESKLMRDKAWDWFNGDVMSRIEPGASVIIVGTRWHADDIIGRIHSDEYESEEYEEINLPAVVDANGMPADERILDDEGNVRRGVFRDDVRSLWPDMRPLSFLEGRRLAGEYDWWALYQGMPQPKGAHVFRADPSRYSLAEFKKEHLSKGGYRFIIAVDPAATASTRADYSVAAVGCATGYGDDMNLYWLHVMRGQWTIPALCRNLGALQQQWRAPMAVEAVGAFKAIPQLLAEADPSLVFFPVELKGDKFARSQPYAAAWNDGRVHTPYDAPWANDWIAEHASFTSVNDKNDDQVDAGAHGFTALLRSQPTRRLETTPYIGPFG